jgi:hypothetical protein
MDYNSNINDKQRAKKNSTRKRLNTYKESLPLLPQKPGEYLIPEIDIKDFYFCSRRLYELLSDDNKEYGKYDDIFMKQIFFSQTGQNEQAWEYFDKQRRFQQGLSARLGDFHEEIAGKLPGYRTLPEGHWSKVDVIKKDRTELYEFKNRVLSGNDKLLPIYKNFKRLIDDNKTTHCVLVFVNVPEGWVAPLPILKNTKKEEIINLTEDAYKGRIHILSGRQAYAHMSGKSDFFERLLHTCRMHFRDANIDNSLSRISSHMDEA